MRKMKSQIGSLLIAVSLATITFYSCNKEKSSTEETIQKTLISESDSIPDGEYTAQYTNSNGISLTIVDKYKNNTLVSRTENEVEQNISNDIKQAFFSEQNAEERSLDFSIKVQKDYPCTRVLLEKNANGTMVYTVEYAKALPNGGCWYDLTEGTNK